MVREKINKEVHDKVRMKHEKHKKKRSMQCGKVKSVRGTRELMGEVRVDGHERLAAELGCPRWLEVSHQRCRPEQLRHCDVVRFAQSTA